MVQLRPLLAVAVLCAIAIALPSRAAAAEPLTIFHADSLTAYVDGLGKEFEKSHPEVTVRHEGTGSLDAIRRVTDLHLPCDILITADYRLLLERRPALESWVLVFAGNAMAILYTGQSRLATTINANNWYDAILSKDVRYSHSNAERDPAGYWTLISWQLAERHYRMPGLLAKLNAGLPPSLIRPKSTDLISLLESGELDYYFGYASDVRLGKQLQALALPAEINLSDFSRADEYRTASVEVGSGDKRKTITGAPIAYGLTMTTNPVNRAAAIDFIKMICGESGRRAAAASGLVVYESALSFDPEKRLPEELRPLAKPASR